LDSVRKRLKSKNTQLKLKHLKKKFFIAKPIVLSRIKTGIKTSSICPVQEQTIDNNIACMTLNRTYFVNAREPFEQIKKIPIINAKAK
jgi:hypothetical protein